MSETRQIAIELLQANTPDKMQEVVKRLLEHERKKHLAALPPAMTWTREYAAMKQELAQLQAANYMWMTTHKELEANYNAVCAMLDPLRQRSEQLDALTLRWSRDTPTKPGWYWWDGGEDTERCVCHVSQEDIDEGKWHGGMDWAGPISPPEEP